MGDQRDEPGQPMTAWRPWRRHYGAQINADFDPEPTTWNALAGEAFERHAERTLIEYYGTRFTYAQIRDLSARAAAAMQAAGIGKGDRVALHLPNCPWHPIFFFGVLAVGGVVTHMSPLDARDILAFKLQASGARLVITLSTPEMAAPWRELLAAGQAPKIVMCDDPVSAAGRECPIPEASTRLEDFWGSADAADVAPVPVLPEDMALLQFTGGTTGMPKAAVLSHANLSAAVLLYHNALKDDPGMEPGAGSLAYSPFFHIMGLVVTLLKRTFEGGLLHVRQRFDAEAAVREIEEKRIATLGGVPTLWIAILQVPGIESRDLSSLVSISSGGAPLPAEVYERVHRLTGLKLRGGWGMTETAPCGTFLPADMPREKLGSIGIPYPGLDIRIVDVDDPARILPPGENGEMAIRGPNVMRGYWNAPEETAAAFHDGWFLTGDVAYMDADGFFFLVDRKKDMILSGGFNVYPVMIENAIHQHPDVSQAIAIGVPDQYRGESAKVYVVLNRGAEAFTLEDLQTFLEGRLGRHEMPRQLEFRDELPQTSVGKPDRKALKAEAARTG